MFNKFLIFLTLSILFIFGIDLILFKNLRGQQPVVKIPSSIQLPIIGSTTPKTTIILTGDIMLGRSVMGTSLAKNDPDYPFVKVSDVLNKSDIVFGNLESPIVSGCPFTNSGLKFCTDPRMVNGLKDSNINVVNIANNHIKNYGADGVIQTEKYLKENEIEYVGAGNLATKTINDIKFGFLGFDFVDYKPADLDYKLVTDSKAKVDVLIVMVHWGIEYTLNPTDSQKLIAGNLVTAGADVIVGNHPHWVQSTEFINNKPVFYSLGNFIFDQPWSEETKSGLAINLTYEENKLSMIEKMPIYMRDLGQPEWSSAPEVISQ